MLLYEDIDDKKHTSVSRTYQNLQNVESPDSLHALFNIPEQESQSVGLLLYN